MIPSRLVGTFVLAVAGVAAPAHAVDDPATDPPEATEASGEVEVEVEDENPLTRHRTRFDVLADRTIGTTSVPVQFNWRRTTAQVAVNGSYLVELNNFNSMRGGAAVRLPSGGVLFEIGVAYASSWDSPSSRLLELTPYRQPGRPNRLDVDFAVGLPLAEGVVTTFPKFFPAVQLVFNAWGGLRYHVYPSGFAGMRTGQVAGALFAPGLTEIELENLEDNRLDSMQVDSGRYGLLLGLGNDIYFGSGFFISPRVMVAVPLLAPASETELYVWSDLSLSLGLAL